MRKLITILSCCTVLLLLGYVSYRGYQVWRQSHGLTIAKRFLDSGDTRSAMLSLQQVLHTNPRNLEACRMMAYLAEAAHSPATLVWRQRVLELDPASVQDRLSLAQDSLVFKDYTMATNALAGIGEADRNTVAYQNLAGTIALMGGQVNEAEARFSEAIRIDPADPLPQVNLSVVRLHMTNALDLAEARLALQKVILTSTNASLSNQARRELVSDAMRFNDLPTALTLSHDLLAQTNSIFDDKLLRMDVLRKANSPEFKPTLATYEREAATNNAKLYELANWQVNQLSCETALHWLQSLPKEVQTNQPAAILAAQCQVQLGEWHDLQTSLQAQNWNELEFMRHALVARALREEGLNSSSTAEWSVALQSAKDEKSSLISLFRFAAAWKWDTEAEQILWTLVKQYPEEKWADTVLVQALTAWHRTRSAMELFAILHQREPNNLRVKNNLAATALLLGAQENNPNVLAQEVYTAIPTNADFASTYAFSLYLQGKNAEALKVMQALPASSLKDASIAGYYGLILKATGHPSDAKAYLNFAVQGHILPEEKTLFDQARAGL